MRVSAIGTVLANNTAVAHVQVGGILQSLAVHEGQEVKAGQALAQLDPRSFQAALDQAKGNLARDQAQLDNAKLDLQRYQNLIKQDAVGRQQLDTQAALVHQLSGTAAADAAAVESAQLQLEYTRVLAPISGRVGIKQVDIGNLAQPSDANGIFVITQIRPVALVFAIPSDALPSVQRALKNKRALSLSASDRSTHEVLANGEVAVLDNAIDTTTDTVKLKAYLPNQDEHLFPNQAVNVSLLVDTLHDALALPTAALSRGAQGSFVYSVDRNQTVHSVPVQVLATDGDWVAIAGDLHPGQRVVIDGVDRLRDDAKVEVIDAATRQAARTAGPAKTTHAHHHAFPASDGAASAASH